MDDSLKILKALADGTRMKIVKFLLNGEKCVCEIIPLTKRTQSTVSIQLGKLEDWGILKSRKEGKKVLYSLKDYRVCDVFNVLSYTEGKRLGKNCCGDK